jgi:hypothetical protein
MEAKCIIILSTKSSGSSACQRFLSMTGTVRHAESTGHYANETLYWTKAASILGLPQVDILASEVPIDRSRAKASLVRLLEDNLGSYASPQNDETLIFDGWRRLCLHYAPVFLEKSPHHLIQWSNLELIQRAIALIPEVRFHIIGLIRNPMDTLYSAWSRWRIDPEKNQYQWLLAYENLLRFKQFLGEQVNIVRYEDMVSDPRSLAREFEFAGIDAAVPANYFHQLGLTKWKNDPLFGFSLAKEVMDLASLYGYSRESMTNPMRLLWPPYRVLARAHYLSLRPLKKAARRARLLSRT